MATRAGAGFAVVRTDHPDPTFSKLTPSAIMSLPTVTVEEIDGCSSNRVKLPIQGWDLTIVHVTYRQQI